MTPSWFKRYLLPGIVFQSSVIAGGYGTGREIVEFFLSLGPVSGLAAMLGVSMVIWSAVAAATFEFARMFRLFEYRGFFGRLLGRGWVLFEICYLLMMMLVLAVIGAAAGTIGRDAFGLPYAAGVAAAIGGVAALLFSGSRAIERFFAGWSLALYAVYVGLFAWSISSFGGEISARFAASRLEGPWILNGVRYAGYNLASAVVVLFVLRHLGTRREAVTAGLLTGLIGILPAALFFVAMVSQYPAIVEEPVPANHLLSALGSRWFQIAFQVVLFGTLIETGTGMIHAVNERLAEARRAAGRRLPAWGRPATATVLLGVALALTPLGLVDLIARGYGTITWGFVLLYVVPVLTVGLWKIRVADRGRAVVAGAGASGA